MSEFATTLTAVLTGGVITYATTASADRRASRRERDAREHARGLEDERRRLDFQRDALVGAQEGLLALWRTSTDLGDRRLQDMRAGLVRMDEERHGAVMGEVANARSAFTMYLERLADDELREALWNAAEALHHITAFTSEDAAAAAQAEMGPAVDAANKALGSALRRLY
jgi:hypothetical protein